MSNRYTNLKNLRLAGIVKTIDQRIKEATDNGMPYSDFIDILLEDEMTNRSDNRNKKYYQQAKFPYQKNLDEFDFSFQPELKKGEITELSTCRFIDKGENIIFIGQPGTGKTHLSISLGLKALSRGYSVLFTTVWDMIDTLKQSRADNSYGKKIDYYLKPDLLILDELGYKAMGETTVEDFFEIIGKRYEKKSTIVTSNRELIYWDKIFIDKTLTGAIVDRLIHHCHTFIIKGDSYRFKNRSVAN